MTEATKIAAETEALRRAANLLCLWRVCGNAACRRAKSCRGRAQLCGRRNYGAVPQGVRDFFLDFLAAKYAGVDYETFEARMEGREQTNIFFAWRKAAREGRA